MACAAEKQRVTLTLMPSEVSRRVAFSPSRVSGHLTTTLGAIPAYSRPSRSMPSASRLVTSAETSPRTISQMAATCARKSAAPSLATSEGLVVTPSTTPSAAPSRISFRFAVSRKNFINDLPGRNPPRVGFRGARAPQCPMNLVLSGFGHILQRLQELDQVVFLLLGQFQLLEVVVVVDHVEQRREAPV